MLWGTEAHLRKILGNGISSLELTERTFEFRFRSAEEFVLFFRLWYGPTLKAFAAVRASPGSLSSETSSRSPGRWDRLGDGGSIAIPAAYTEAIATRS